jgi:hypothetical protein
MLNDYLEDVNGLMASSEVDIGRGVLQILVVVFVLVVVDAFDAGASARKGRRNGVQR